MSINVSCVERNALQWRNAQWERASARASSTASEKNVVSFDSLARGASLMRNNWMNPLFSTMECPGISGKGETMTDVVGRTLKVKSFESPVFDAVAEIPIEQKKIWDCGKD